MLAKGEQYKPPTEYLFLNPKRKLRLASLIKKNIAKFDLKLGDVSFHKLLNTNIKI